MKRVPLLLLPLLAGCNEEPPLVECAGVKPIVQARSVNQSALAVEDGQMQTVASTANEIAAYCVKEAAAMLEPSKASAAEIAEITDWRCAGEIDEAKAENPSAADAASVVSAPDNPYRDMAKWTVLRKRAGLCQ